VNEGVPRWIGIVLILAGAALCIPILFGDLPLAVRGVRTTGVVTEMQGPRRRQVPIVRFTTSARKEVTFRGFRQTYEIGQQVAVIYPPANPKAAQIYSWRTFWLGVIFVSVLGGAMIAGGVAIVRRRAA
jgi:hypothetical protein